MMWVACLLLAACAGAPAVATPSAMQARLASLPGGIKVKVGDSLAGMAPVMVDLPDGRAQAMTLAQLIASRGAQRGLLWFYVQDSTSL